jgi:hypothetical protein
MIVFRSRSGQSVQGEEAVGRLGRAIGRLVLWACVVVLLIRGIASVLAGPPARQVSPPAKSIVTVTQPAPAAAPSTGSRR